MQAERNANEIVIAGAQPILHERLRVKNMIFLLKIAFSSADLFRHFEHFHTLMAL